MCAEDELDGFEFILINRNLRGRKAPSRRKPKREKGMPLLDRVKAALEIIRFFLISSTYLSRQKKSILYEPVQYTDSFEHAIMTTTTEMMEMDSVKPKNAKLCVNQAYRCLSWY
jgi:hypothetical protein